MAENREEDVPDSMEDGLIEICSPQKPLVINAIQSNIQLGSFYDRRSDNFPLKLRLWFNKILKRRSIIEVRKPAIQEDTFDDKNTFISKAKTLEIDDGIKVSLISGMVEAEGHLKHLIDDQQSKYVAKASLTYKVNSSYRELDAAVLDKVDYKNLLTNKEIQDKFTHVVVAIEYGGRSTVVIEKDVNQNNNKQNVQDALALELKSIYLSAEKNLKFDSNIGLLLNGGKFFIYSDMITRSNFLNWTKVLKYWHSLSKSLCADGGTPIKVWLLPKKFFGSYHETLLNELSHCVVIKILKVAEFLTTIINRYNDFEKHLTEYPVLERIVYKLEAYFVKYRTALLEHKLARTLMAARMESQDKSSVAEAIKYHDNSLFNKKCLTRWLDKLNTEATNMRSLHNAFTSDGFVLIKSVKEDVVVLHREIKVIFTLCLREENRAYLRQLKKYLKSMTEAPKENSDEAMEIEFQKWYENKLFLKRLNCMVYQLKKLAAAKKSNEKIDFFFRIVEAKGNPDSRAEIFMQLYIESVKYLPLVENLPVQTSHDAATIQWKHPTLGMEHVSGYRVVLKQVSIFDQKVPTQTVKVEEIRYSTEEEEKYIAYGLESRNMYHIAVHCIGYNFSFISQDVSADVVTLSSFPPCNFAEPFTKETKQANGPDFLEDTSQKLLLINALQSNFQLGYERRTNSFPPELKLKFKNTLKQLSINGVRKMSNQKYIFDDKNTFNSKTQALEKDDGIKESATNEVIDGAVKTVPVTHLCSLIATVIDSREVTLTWKPPNLTSQGSNLESYILKYKESLVEVEWKSISLPKEKDSYVFNQLLFGTEYSFKILGVYERNREVLLTETVNRKTVELDVPQIISVSLKKDSVTVIWNALTYEPLKYCIRYKLDDDWSTCFLELENVLMSYKKDKLLTKVKICCDKPRNYCFQIQSVCKFGESKWSEEFYHFKNEEEEDFPEIDGQCDDEDNKSFYHVNDVITECDIRWAIKHYGWVLEKNSSTPSKSKSIATMRLLQDIAKMKYQSFNIPLQWHDELGMHIAVNHPMDILHDVILKANFSLRSKLYQKLGFCHLSVPVLFPSDQDLYMNLSLKSIIVARRESDKLIEENVTKSPLCVISMMRIGQQAISSLSKSKLCNDLLGFNINSKLGSCGFYTRNALSSNTNRKTSEGTVEGIWYHNLSHTEKDFSKTFSLLNLRGDVLHHISSAASLASASDALFALCGEDMFKDDRHLDLLNALAENNSQSSLKKLVVLMTKESVSYVKSNRDLFKKVCSNVRYKIIDENYHKLLDTLTVEIEDTLEETLPKPSLNERFTRVAPEYISKSSTAKDVSESFLKELDRMKMSNAQERAQIRKNLFPIQSTIKRYTEAQKKETRTRNLDQKYKYRDEISAVKKEQLEIIQNGLPYHMSIFLKEISKSNCIEKKLRYLSDVKNYIDDWSFTHISDVRYQYSVATKELNLLKKKETNTAKDEFTFSIEQRDLQMRCDNLSIFLLDISIGVETIIREIGGIYETIYRNHDSLNKELNKCMNMLPEFAASLLLNGIALELLDGDGLSVPVTWLKEVFKVFKKSYMEFYELKHEPRIFVLTVLGTQSSGKSTLLNIMFGIQFPVSAGRCTKGAYLQLIPISLEGYKNDAILVVDTEGLGAPEYKNNNTHDNEIATFVLGISDVAIVNVRGELPNDIEDFLEVSICALMKMNMVDFHPKVVFVHQNCDPSAKQKNVTRRNTFMKLMDEVVVAQAKIMQKRYRHFQDIVDISLEHDIFYFPQLMEGSGSMAPPNASYSKACSELRNHILTKMLFSKSGSLSLDEFCKKIEMVWNGILEENFVLNQINNSKIQARYKIENKFSIWRSKTEFSLNEQLDIIYNDINSFF